MRQNKGITQEQLANSLGISFQAVSKWENGISMPDITFLPSITNFFNIKIDNLFSYDQKTSEKIKKICDEVRNSRESNPVEALSMLQRELENYPESDLLLNEMLYFTGKNPDKTISVAGKLISNTNDASIRYNALRFLAYAYHSKGDTEKAGEAIEQMPHMDFTKLSEAAFILEGEASVRQLRSSLLSPLELYFRCAQSCRNIMKTKATHAKRRTN